MFPRTRTSRPSPPLLLLALAALLLTGAVATACGGGSSSGGDGGAAAIVSTGTGAQSRYAGIVRTPAPFVGDLSLPAPDGKAFPLKPAAGDVLLVYFGYTHCPDVCPTTLADLRAALRTLPADQRDRVRIAMITVDPERDTPRLLDQYLTSFFPDGVALSTKDAAQLAKVAKAFAAAYEVTKAADGTIDVIHSAFLYAVGPDGRIIVQWPFGTSAADEARDLSTILADIGATGQKEAP